MRWPNPWILWPSLIGGGLGGTLGWIVTDVSCRVEVDGVIQSCPGWSTGMAVLGFFVGSIGVGTLLVLVYRSIAEARDAHDRGVEPPDPGCETG